MCNLCRCRHLLSHNQYKVHTVHPFGGRWRFDIAIIFGYDICFLFPKYFWLLPDEIVCRLDTFARHIPKEKICMPKASEIIAWSKIQPNPSWLCWLLSVLLSSPPFAVPYLEPLLRFALPVNIDWVAASSRVASHHIASLFGFFFVFYSIIVICNCVCVCW